MATRVKGKKARVGEQIRIAFPVRNTWGGKRAGAGRKPGKRRLVVRCKRPEFRKDSPMHVTLRVLPEAAGLRRRHLYREVRRSFLRCGNKEQFRICEFSIQGNHLHLMCEARDRTALSRGVQGFSSSVARRLNRVRGTSGKVFADRYHVRVLSTPTEVRHALSYVLNNWRRHKVDKEHPQWRTDPYSSANLFDGWVETSTSTSTHRPKRPVWLDPDEPIPIARPRSWLLTTGWRKLGLLSPREVPGG